MSTKYDISQAREASGRAGTSTTPRAPRRVQTKALPHFLPRQSLDDSEEANNFTKIMDRGMKSPSSAMGRWLGELPDHKELSPNEHFAIGEYDDANGYRRSAMFVYERVGELPPVKNDYPGWNHPRPAPLPPTFTAEAFNPADFARTQPSHADFDIEIAEQQPSFKLTTLNSVETGKIVLKRFAKTAGKVLKDIAVMPDYNSIRSHPSYRSGPSISRPFKTEERERSFTTISIEEAQARNQGRKAAFQQKQAEKPLERRQIGHPDRQTDFGDFINYRSCPNIQPKPLPLSPPRIPSHINRPTRKPLPARGPPLNLNKSLPPSPDADSLRRRTRMPPGAKPVEQPDILAVPKRTAVVNHRNAVVSQYGLVVEESDVSEEEKISWPGTPANFDPTLKNKPLWWQFERSEEELDPTQVVWARMEESLRNGWGIRGASGSALKDGKL